VVKPLNHTTARNFGEETFERFVEDVFFPMKVDTDWRENTAKESRREIRKHLISELGELQFQEITAALLRALLNKKAEQALGKQILDHIRFYLTDICRSATAEGYLTNNVSGGLKAPKKLIKTSTFEGSGHPGAIRRRVVALRRTGALMLRSGHVRRHA
jgi:integrase-like protein